MGILLNALTPWRSRRTWSSVSMKLSTLGKTTFVDGRGQLVNARPANELGQPLSARLRLHQEPPPAAALQAPRVQAVSRVFAGTSALDTTSRCRGAEAKHRMVAKRTGAPLPTALEGAGRSILAASPRKHGKRCFPNTPMMQSIVDQVVFGQDMDNSGEDQFDEEFMDLYSGAGLSSQELARMATVQGIKPFPNVPTMQSVVDQVVFGRDMDFSGEEQFDDEFLKQYSGRAGRLTIMPH